MLQQIRDFLNRAPFHPFEVHCSSGEVYRVDHPENAAIVGNFVVVALPGGKKATMISPPHITGVSGVQNVEA